MTNYVNGISIIISTMRENCMKNVFDNYERQDFKRKEMIIILNNNKMNIDNWLEESKKYKNIRIFRLDENIPLGTCLNFGISYAKYNIIAKFDDDDYYGPKYLSDSIKSFELTNADIIGKATLFVYFKKQKLLAIMFPNRGNRHVRRMGGSTFLIKKRVFKKVKFANIPKGIDTQFCKDCIKNGFKIYSTNKYHYVYIRHKTSKEHTWKINDEDLLKICTIVQGDIDDFRKFVDI